MHPNTFQRALVIQTDCKTTITPFTVYHAIETLANGPGYLIPFFLWRVLEILEFSKPQVTHQLLEITSKFTYLLTHSRQPWFVFDTHLPSLFVNF